MPIQKTAYICGPLTELEKEVQKLVKDFYVRIGNLFKEITGVRAFVPHEHFDSVNNPDPSPEEVYRVEYNQVVNRTSVLLVVAIEPSWGGGMEVQMANTNGISIIILHPAEKKISRLLRGSPMLRGLIPYQNYDDAIGKLQNFYE